MRLAVIDLGTNSVRFDVHQIGPGNRIRQLHREKLMVRLGQGVFLDGKLDKEAIRRTVHAFQSFQQTSKDLHAQKIVAFGTSALREASDSEQLLSLIRSETGIDVRVISGQEEARLIAQGILCNEKLPKGTFALLDIGGGSAEVSICRGRAILHSESFALGTARLQQIYLKSSPPKSPRPGELSPIEQLRRFIKGTILPKVISEGWPKVGTVVGSSGTVRALGRMLKKQGGDGQTIVLKDLRKLVKAMSVMTTSQLLGVPGMEAKRVDMILAGAILLEETMSALGAKRAITTEYSLRDGILEEELQLAREHQGSHLALHLPDLYAKAQRLGGHEPHLRQVVGFAEALFARLRNLHKLGPEWQVYLKAAAILHDTGEAISPNRHSRHSYYIVKNADFPSMEAWEVEFIAQLCLWHATGKPEPRDFPFRNHKKRSDAFYKLLAMLRVADALDRGHTSSARILRASVDARKVRLTLTGKAIDLEILRVEQKKALFEQVFGRTLEAGRASS
jgi:exopolyphosphatase/guanosine-5'-triphosphate,3'-diphosphate pyrophosphatase